MNRKCLSVGYMALYTACMIVFFSCGTSGPVTSEGMQYNGYGIVVIAEKGMEIRVCEGIYCCTGLWPQLLTNDAGYMNNINGIKMKEYKKGDIAKVSEILSHIAAVRGVIRVYME